MSRSLCKLHPDVDYKTAWGCPDCLAELRNDVRKLGKLIPCYTGGTFENDPVDAILNAAERYIQGFEQSLAASQKDAERYRYWRRRAIEYKPEGDLFTELMLKAKNEDAIDYAVDAAITGESK